jgi:hypothetical protein
MVSNMDIKEEFNLFSMKWMLSIIS